MSETSQNGVSNGDVDWLFRGKQGKKLAKRATDIKSSELVKKSLGLNDKVENFSIQIPGVSASKEPMAGFTKVDSEPKSAPRGIIKSKTDLTSSRQEAQHDGSTRRRSLSTGTVQQLPTEPRNMHVPNRSTSSGGEGLSRCSSTGKKSLFSSLSSKLKAGQTVGSNSTSSLDKGIFGRRKRGAEKSDKSPLSTPSTPSISTSPTSETGLAHLPRLETSEKLPNASALSTVSLKRVTFAVQKLQDDPQQQIPSRKPRRGNVLVPNDLVGGIPKLNIGISLSTDEHSKVDERELKLAVESREKACKESEKHALEAHHSARQLAKETASYLNSSKTSKAFSSQQDPKVPFSVSSPPTHVAIDSPIHQHVDYFQKQKKESEKSEEPTLELIYTRCCHLREILPIPATLKQLAKKSAPLQVLKLLNPKPTLIDVLSFSDFLAITPITTVILDNVFLTHQMLKVILSSLVNSRWLEKLSLRNVPINEEGWLFLSKFLMNNKSITKLDLSQQKIKSELSKTHSRSKRNWKLLTDALSVRGGICELVINGCNLSFPDFDYLLTNGVSLSTLRLGVANAGLDLEKMDVLCRWISQPTSTCCGIDLGFNDFSTLELVQPLIDVFTAKKATKLNFLSLNSTNLTPEIANRFIESLVNVESLRFLDLSGNPKIFPKVIPTLTQYLPKYKSLRRIHFELADLTSDEVIAISSAFPDCKELIHVSFLGNPEAHDYATIATLYTAIRRSNIHTLDIEFDQIEDEELTSKIAIYMMINMQKSINKDFNLKFEDDIFFDASILTKTAEKLLNKDGSSSASEKSLLTQESKIAGFLQSTEYLQKQLHSRIDELFEKRLQGKISLEDKETLLRLCLLDNSLEKVLNLLDENRALEKIPSNSNDRSSAAKTDAVASAVIQSGPILSPHLHYAESKESGYFSATQSFDAEAPHNVVIDTTQDGLNVPVDSSTGKPVLMRRSSSYSTQGKLQEEEEGEFHKWGFFVQQQNAQLPTSDPFDDVAKLKLEDNSAIVDEDSKSQLPEDVSIKTSNGNAWVPISGKIPSGSQLKAALLKLKGIESIDELIERINSENQELETIYKLVSNAQREPQPELLSPSASQSNIASQKTASANMVNSQESMNKSEVDESSSAEPRLNPEDEEAVDKAYDKLLEEVVRDRTKTK
ncbi:hypothetical protein LJB42_000111 [Komagataella kurtzmanii]|nr:hypothetical protein LJB42_000111 [Komagataella kurtzmanii]